MTKVMAGIMAAGAAALVRSGCYSTTSERPVPNPNSVMTTASGTSPSGNQDACVARVALVTERPNPLAPQY